MFLSSANNGELKSQSFNYTDTDLKQDWGPSVKEFFTTKSYYCSASNKPYVAFTDLNQNVDFIISRFEGRVSLINDITPKDITKFLILNGDAGLSDEKVYSTMNPTVITTMEDKVKKAIEIFNPGVGNYNKTPPPANSPSPDPFDFVVENVGGSFNKLTVTIKPNQGLWEMFVAEFKFFKTTSECSGESSGSGRRLDEYLSLNKQIFTITKQNILNDENCGPNTPQQDLIGKYTYTIWVRANPILPGGKLDNSRQQSMFRYDFSFQIK